MAVASANKGEAIRAVIGRFGEGLAIDAEQLQSVIETAIGELQQVAAVLRMSLRLSPFARAATAFAGQQATAEEAATDEAEMATDVVVAEVAAAGEAPGEAETEIAVPADAETVLAACIEDISNSLVEDFSLNDILYITVETMYRAMGFQRVLLCLKDVKTGQMAGRFGFGADTNDIAGRFRFPLGSANDIFALAAAKAADVIIADIDDPKIAERVPAWYRQLTGAKTFVLFPLNIKGSPVALIYCDKLRAGTISIPEKELSLLKTLRNQALLALKQSM
jgi:hypothetical protein